MKVSKLLDAHKKNDSIEITPGLPSRVPTEEDIAKARANVKKLAARAKAESKRLDAARNAFHKALDRMIQKLAPSGPK